MLMYLIVDKDIHLNHYLSKRILILNSRLTKYKKLKVVNVTKGSGWISKTLYEKLKK